MAIKLRMRYFLAVICLAAMSCSHTGGVAKSAKDSTAKEPAGGSHEERTYRAAKVNLSKYQAVFIESPSVDTTASRNEKVDDFLKQLQGTTSASLQQALHGSGHFTTVTTVKKDAVSNGKYLICRSDVMVHFGSTAARMLVGMGAGRSKLVVVTSLEDPETGEVIVKYTGWGGAVGGFGFQILGKMQADVTTIAQYFGNLVRTLPKA